MRALTSNAQTLLSQNMGTEIITLLEVEWVSNGRLTYSDQVFEDAHPIILSMGGFDGSMMLEGSSDSQSLSVTLDDVDGHLKNIYLSNDIHKRPARVYLQHKGLPSTDKILVFRGEIVTPITWDEASRSLTFTILSKLNSRQVGFSMEEGEFPNIPEEALGQAWPLVFGQVCHLPAVKVRAPRRGYLQEGTGIHDFTLHPRICQALRIECPSQSTGTQTFWERGANNQWEAKNLKTVGPDLECVNRRFAEICKLRDLLEQQLAYENTTLNIYNGVNFPQGREVTLYANEAVFIGTFSGNSFHVRAHKHPAFDSFEHQPCKSVPQMGYGTKAGPSFAWGHGEQAAGGYWQVSQYAGSGRGRAVWFPSGNATIFRNLQNAGEAFASCDAALVPTRALVGGPPDSWKYYDDMKEAGFFWAPAGTEVYIEEESEILYIVSLLPGTVDGVAAYRRGIDGVNYLTEVPTDYYTVYETDYDGYQVVEIGLTKELSKRTREDGKSENWSDQLYVSFTSSVGPNPCDIIEWLIEKYTDLSIDSTSFNSVKAMLTNYPNNFYLTARPDVYSLINDIAYQSRCAVYVRNDVVYIRYLSREPDSVRTITESDILSGSFKELLSETEDVYTTHNVEWKNAGASKREDVKLERKIILKYNVGKYGTVEDSWDYYTYNIYSLVLKSATFWLIRKANTWRKVSFDLPIKHIDLDVGDCITLSVNQFGASVKTIIESFQINPDENKISVVCWTPIRSGETEEFFWAWPSLKSQVARWPLPGDTNGGGGYSFTVSPPIGHLLRGGSHRDDQIIITTGDLTPSDLDDTLPSVVCSLSDYVNFIEIDPIIEAKEIAQSAARAGMENNISGGGNSGGDSGKKADKEEAGGCGEQGIGCNYIVRVQWHKSMSQGQATSQGGSKPGGPCGGPCRCLGGCPSCFGPIWITCHTFGSPNSARRAVAYFKGMYGKPDGYWLCEDVGVLNASAGNGSYVPLNPNDTSTFEDNCESISDSNDVDAGEAPYEQPDQQSGPPTGATGDEPDLGDGKYENASDNPYYSGDAPEGSISNPYTNEGSPPGEANPYT